MRKTLKAAYTALYGSNYKAITLDNTEPLPTEEHRKMKHQIIKAIAELISFHQDAYPDLFAASAALSGDVSEKECTGCQVCTEILRLGKLLDGPKMMRKIDDQPRGFRRARWNAHTVDVKGSVYDEAPIEVVAEAFENYNDYSLRDINDTDLADHWGFPRLSFTIMKTRLLNHPDYLNLVSAGISIESYRNRVKAFKAQGLEVKGEQILSWKNYNKSNSVKRYQKGDREY